MRRGQNPGDCEQHVAHPHRDAGANDYAHANDRANPYLDSNRCAQANRDALSDRDVYPDAHGDADARAHGNANGHRYAYPNRRASGPATRLLIDLRKTPNGRACLYAEDPGVSAPRSAPATDLYRPDAR